MSLSAKERILKLRETEFKLNQLQNDLLRGDQRKTTSFMSKFLEHHKELMALPGSTRNSIPFRFGFQASQRYIEARKPARLTIPPKMDFQTTTQMKPFYKEPELNPYEKIASQGSYAVRHPSLALQSLITELEDQTEKMAVAFPKFDRHALLNKTPFLRSVQPLNSMRYVNPVAKKSKSGNVDKTVSAYKAHSKQLMKSMANVLKSKTTAVIFSKSHTLDTADTDNNKSVRAVSPSSSKTKVGVRWINEKSQVSAATSNSDIASVRFSKSDLRMPFEPFRNNANKNALMNNNGEEKEQTRSEKLKELRETVAYAMESQNLMGVILPNSKKGPKSWALKPTQSRGVPAMTESEEKMLSAKDALQLLKRRDREFPERKTFNARQNLHPHERGLIGVEISGFDPQCAFFYRDRNGNYNPHLQHATRVVGSTSNKQLTKSLVRNP